LKLLYLTTCSPWKTSFGGAIRSAGILRGLARRHQIEIAFFTPDPTSARADPPAGIERVRLVPVRDAHSPWASACDRVERRAARRRCLELVREWRPDVVWYFEKAAVRVAGITPGTPIVVDLNDLPWLRLVRTAAQQRGRERARTALRAVASWVEDRWLCRRADVTVLANAEEALRLRRHDSVWAIPNGADFTAPPSPTPRASKRILHLGGLWYPPNLDGLRWFCREAWPRVLAVEPDAWLDVVGQSDAHAGELGAMPHVNRRGFVDDLAAASAASALLVVPLRIATGTRTKILEAWANGLPVVSTTIGAEGLAACDGETALIADTAEALAAACVRLLCRPELGASLAARGFEHGRERFSWEAIYPTLDAVLLRALRR
jgi:glycosyltransferase involved in cell wall biosynthesis